VFPSAGVRPEVIPVGCFLGWVALVPTAWAGAVLELCLFRVMRILGSPSTVQTAEVTRFWCYQVYLLLSGQKSGDSLNSMLGAAANVCWGTDTPLVKTWPLLPCLLVRQFLQATHN
jgi:hypothetical protein